MRKDAIFIGIEVEDRFTSDPALGAKLNEVCPVNIFKGTDSGVDIVEENIDECVLCGLCYDAAPDGAVSVLKLYADGEALRP
jgi:NAD-dependent dihydropyrimidine dehydrogenase PreA subunit